MIEREATDHILGQHGELASRHVRGREALARHGIDRRARRKAEGWRRNVDPDAHASGEPLHRKGVVDLRGADVVQAEGRRRGARQVRGQRRHLMGRKHRPAGKKLVQEALQVVSVAVRQPSAAREELRRRKARLGTSLLKRLGLRLVAIRGIKQFVLQRGYFRWALASSQRLGPRDDLLLYALFFLHRGKRELQRRLGRRLVAPPAPAVEIHRRPMQLHQHAGRFDRGRVASDVVARQLLEAEFPRAAAFPQEFHLQPGGEFLRPGEQLGRRWPLERKQDVRGLDLGAPAVRAFDVKRGRCLVEHRPDLQVTVFLIEKLHGKTRVCGAGAAGSFAGCGRRPRSPPAPLRHSARPPCGSRALRRRSRR